MSRSQPGRACRYQAKMTRWQLLEWPLTRWFCWSEAFWSYCRGGIWRYSAATLFFPFPQRILIVYHRLILNCCTMKKRAFWCCLSRRILHWTLLGSWLPWLSNEEKRERGEKRRVRKKLDLKCERSLSPDDGPGNSRILFAIPVVIQWTSRRFLCWSAHSRRLIRRWYSSSGPVCRSNKTHINWLYQVNAIVLG